MSPQYDRISVEALPQANRTLWYVFGLTWGQPKKKVLAICPTQSLANTMRDELSRRATSGQGRRLAAQQSLLPQLFK